MNLEAKLLTLVAVIALAFGGGWFTKGKFVQAAQTKQAKAEVKQYQQAEQGTAKNVVAANDKSQVIEQKVQASNTRVKAIQSAAAKRVITQEKAREQYTKELFRKSELQAGHPAAGVDEAQAGSVCGRFEFDVGTVRLLNDARAGQAGAAVDPTAGSDAASQAPSGVGIPALIDNDLEIVKQYHELAERHDALVDSVEQELKRRAGETPPTPAQK